MASSSSSLSKSVSFLLLLFTSPSFSSATATYPTINDRRKLQAEKLIRGLNLFPKDSVNTRLGDPRFIPGKIVEKKFSFLGASGPSVEELGHHAWHYLLPHSKAASKDDPVAIWLTGGPGCGSEVAMFYENAPFQFANNLSLVWNDYGWDKAANILYIDQPTGTGFSYTSDETDLRYDEGGVSNDLYDFLQAFFKEHPQFVNDFYITGESYAGHYIPALASRVHQGNKEKRGIHINLKYQSYTDFALDRGLITKADYDSINKLFPRCEQTIKTCETEGGQTCVSSFTVCNEIFNQILSINGNINYYDIRKECVGTRDQCYDYSKLETFLNEKTVKDALGVGDLDFVLCNSTVHDTMLQDWMRNLDVGIPSLLEDGIRVLVYAGEEDVILQLAWWVHAMEWSGQKEFGASPTVPFLVDAAEAGSLKSHGPLTFVKVHGAGHMVPMDQPKAALELLRSWMEGIRSVTRKGDNVSPI